jgi:arginyl-tRNA synthetase
MDKKPTVSAMNPQIKALIDEITARIPDAEWNAAFEAPRFERVLVDYGRIATARPLTADHLRGMILGDSLTAIMRAFGAEAITDAHPTHSELWEQHAIHAALAQWQSMLAQYGFQFDLWLDSSDSFVYFQQLAHHVQASEPVLHELAAIMQRAGDFEIAQIICVTPTAQQDRVAGWIRRARGALIDSPANTVDLVSIGFGALRQPDGAPFSTDEHGSVDLRVLFAQLSDAASAHLRQHGGVSRLMRADQAPETVRFAIAAAALRVGVLMHPADRSCVFDPVQATDFTCYGGAYLLYTLALVTRDRQSAAEHGWEKGALQPPQTEAEAALIAVIARFPCALRQAYDQCAPHLLAHYASAFADAYHYFMRSCRPARAVNSAQRASWILLIDLSERILRTLLDLLGLSISPFLAGKAI